jgi:hypothetical protein
MRLRKNPKLSIKLGDSIEFKYFGHYIGVGRVYYMSSNLRQCFLVTLDKDLKDTAKNMDEGSHFDGKGYLKGDSLAVYSNQVLKKL